MHSTSVTHSDKGHAHEKAQPAGGSLAITVTAPNSQIGSSTATPTSSSAAAAFAIRSEVFRFGVFGIDIQPLLPASLSPPSVALWWLSSLASSVQHATSSATAAPTSAAANASGSASASASAAVSSVYMSWPIWVQAVNHFLQTLASPTPTPNSNSSSATLATGTATATAAAASGGHHTNAAASSSSTYSLNQNLSLPNSSASSAFTQFQLFGASSINSLELSARTLFDSFLVLQKQLQQGSKASRDELVGVDAHAFLLFLAMQRYRANAGNSVQGLQHVASASGVAVSYLSKLPPDLAFSLGSLPIFLHLCRDLIHFQNYGNTPSTGSSTSSSSTLSANNRSPVASIRSLGTQRVDLNFDLQRHEFNRLGFIMCVCDESAPIRDGITTKYSELSTLAASCPLFNNPAPVNANKVYEWLVQHFVKRAQLPSNSPAATPGPSGGASSSAPFSSFFLPSSIAHISIHDVHDQTVLYDPDDFYDSCVTLARIYRSSIYLATLSRYVCVDDVQQSIINVGVCSGIVRLQNCVDVTLTSASHALHLSACNGVTAFIFSDSKPILFNESSDIILAPYNSAYPNLHQHVQQAKLSVDANEWDHPIIIRQSNPGSSNTGSPAPFSPSQQSARSNSARSSGDDRDKDGKEDRRRRKSVPDASPHTPHTPSTPNHDDDDEKDKKQHSNSTATSTAHSTTSPTSTAPPSPSQTSTALFSPAPIPMVMLLPHEDFFPAHFPFANHTKTQNKSAKGSVNAAIVGNAHTAASSSGIYSSPFTLPAQYSESLHQRRQRALQCRRMLDDVSHNLNNQQRNALEARVSAKFQQWLHDSFPRHYIQNMLRFDAKAHAQALHTQKQ